ncbi:hypothetical protein [Arthrobacter psychrolactophilus]
MKTAQSLGLRPANPAEKYGQFAALKFDVEVMAEQGRLHELQPLFAQAWESKDRLPNGERIYSAILGWVQVDAPDDTSEIAGYLAPFAVEFDRNPTSFSASLYAEALHHAAFAARGTAYERQTSKSQFGGHDNFTSQARAVLHSIADVADDDVAWWNARYSLTQSDASTDAERHEIFSKLIALDPGSITVFNKAMLLALPRWFGQNATDADRIARWAMEANQEQWGAGGYAIAYWALTDTDDLDASETVIDVALAEQGFRDLLNRVPSIPVQNMFAQTMSWANAEPVVKDIFESGLQAIDPFAWDAESEEHGVELAARAYHWAKSNS